MTRPIISYKYYAWDVKNYDEWAEKAYKSEDGMLDHKYARKLEEIYSSDKYTSEQHKENIAFLEKLQYILAHIWSSAVREKTGMSGLVGDYKSYFMIR